MSRIGKKPVAVPAGVTAKVDGQTVTVKGAKGELSFVVHDDVARRTERQRRSRSIRVTKPSAPARCGARRAPRSTI